MMKTGMKMLAAAALVLSAPLAQADPASDNKNIHEYFKGKFPSVPTAEYANGVYSVDPILRANWEAIEEFPPYEPLIEDGEAMWNKSFANGKSYASCFGKPGVRAQYPHWDKAKGMVMTLPIAINNCRKANGEKPLKYKKGKITRLLAYMGYESRGQTINVKIPSDDPRAMAAYEDGKQFFYARRGQLNFSCAHCHVQSAGQKVRTNTLSPALGHATGWPVYRSKWGDLGTLHRRFSGCNKQVRAKPFKAQGKEYRNLEYFLTHMSNGIDFNGPSARQ